MHILDDQIVIDIEHGKINIVIINKMEIFVQCPDLSMYSKLVFGFVLQF